MASIDRTAYPRLGKRLSVSELEAQYAITDEEAHLVRLTTNGDSPRLTFLALLKTRQHLGYFPSLLEFPDQIIRFLAESFGLPQITPLLDAEIKKQTLFRYRAVIRSHVGGTAYGDDGDKLIEPVIRTAALTMSDPADLINVAIETLMQSNVELPAYSTLDRQRQSISACGLIAWRSWMSFSTRSRYLPALPTRRSGSLPRRPLGSSSAIFVISHNPVNDTR